MGREPDRSRGIHLAALVLILCLCLVVLLTYFCQRGWCEPALAEWTRFLSFCPFRAMTGAPCPLCGATTAFVRLLQGELKASLEANPLAYSVTPAILSQLVYRTLKMRWPSFAWREEAVLSVLSALSTTAVAAGSFLCPLYCV